MPDGRLGQSDARRRCALLNDAFPDYLTLFDLAIHWRLKGRKGIGELNRDGIPDLVGTPAKVARMLSADEIARLPNNAHHYSARGQHYTTHLQAIEPFS